MNDTVMLCFGSALIIAALIAAVFVFRAYRNTGGRKFRVDYHGRMQFFKDAKESYRAGQRVVLTYGPAATDTRYTFLLDGEELNYRYDDALGFILEFTMPPRDVSLDCLTENLMVADDLQTDDTQIDATQADATQTNATQANATQANTTQTDDPQSGE